MRTKKTTKPGECAAMRCVRTDIVGANGLCERHDQEWKAAGSPPLAEPPSKATPTQAAGMVLDPKMHEDLELERQRTVDALVKAQAFPVDTAAGRDKMAGYVNKAK